MILIELYSCGSGRKCQAPVTVMRLIRKKANLQNHEESKTIEFDSGTKPAKISTPAIMMIKTINKEWHLKHKFPKKGKEEEKNRWRKEHRKNCGCGRK